MGVSAAGQVAVGVAGRGSRSLRPSGHRARRATGCRGTLGRWAARPAGPPGCRAAGPRGAAPNRAAGCPACGLRGCRLAVPLGCPARRAAGLPCPSGRAAALRATGGRAYRATGLSGSPCRWVVRPAGRLGPRGAAPNRAAGLLARRAAGAFGQLVGGPAVGLLPEAVGRVRLAACAAGDAVRWRACSFGMGCVVAGRTAGGGLVVGMAGPPAGGPVRRRAARVVRWRRGVDRAEGMSVGAAWLVGISRPTDWSVGRASSGGVVGGAFAASGGDGRGMAGRGHQRWGFVVA